jgi:hypothetical protein
MKKAFKFLFALVTSIYLVNSVGVPIYYHYCGGELESVSAVFKPDACCEGMEEEEDSDCCKNEVKVIAQFNDSYSEVSSYKIIAPVSSHFDLPTNFFKPILIDEHSILHTLFVFDKPPSGGREILELKSVLII